MNPLGNVYDKYGTRNPIARALMRGFLGSVEELVRQSGANSVLEVGCGEGELARHLVLSSPAPPQRFEICDLSLGRLRPDLPPPITACEASVYALPYPSASFDLVICCEVLEHLDDPRAALREVCRVAARRVLLSTPWEPVWRVLNVLRGKYLRALGNTPGHVQHFSRAALLDLARTELQVLDVRTPLPWTVLLGEVRS